MRQSAKKRNDIASQHQSAHELQLLRAGRVHGKMQDRGVALHLDAPKYTVCKTQACVQFQFGCVPDTIKAAVRPWFEIREQPPCRARDRLSPMWTFRKR